jgi:ABC-type phosphate transport system auxiliary subunit
MFTTDLLTEQIIKAPRAYTVLERAEVGEVAASRGCIKKNNKNVSVVTTAWRVLRSRMEETVSRCGG